ncbi:RNA polymerase sigma factor [Dyadobacter fanqingshengii]|uniref:Sigma-70 family RNA polymerase sigma factor n=1 Tax=Dyadobacter fanqingshengii TaxID=2906443 RepID=A0A9X1PEH8_9BACT|nr:sigma-70 family RNA polymerase sigma factor [Dyadobacter fanqingshengii]MCF0043526.1 sigma-70 family RNA polymerase sigma factor [Dyadobacter fanqingshengii]USJ34855.1 sigma-70 family RNA polymerase sigma factor [Dyadobacter fanqingshengii]
MKTFTSNIHQQEEEIALWREMLKGDIACFEKLIDVTYDLLFQYGSKFSHDREMIKDCIQDVFLEVWEKKDSLNHNIPPKAYLLASLRRRLHRMIQKNRMLFLDHLLPDEGFDIAFNAEHQFIQLEYDQQMASRITHMLNGLPKRQKEAIYLKFFEDMDRDEIAAIMDIHPQSVSNLLQTAFKFLKSQWRSVVSLFLLLRFIA